MAAGADVFCVFLESYPSPTSARQILPRHDIHHQHLLPVYVWDLFQILVQAAEAKEYRKELLLN